MANTIGWFDLPVNDLERAMAFYSKVTAKELAKAWPGMEVATFQHGDGDVAGCLYKEANAKPSDHGVLVYFNVSGRLDDAVREVGNNGGKVLQAREQIGPHGFRAIVLDSEGNRIALHSED